MTKRALCATTADKDNPGWYRSDCSRYFKHERIIPPSGDCKRCGGQILLVSDSKLFTKKSSTEQAGDPQD